MKLLLVASLLWGPSLYAAKVVEPAQAEVIFPNTPDPARNNPSVNPVPDTMDEKQADQTLRAPKDRLPSSEKQEAKEKRDAKPRTMRPVGPNKW